MGIFFHILGDVLLLIAMGFGLRAVYVAGTIRHFSTITSRLAPLKPWSISIALLLAGSGLLALSQNSVT